jgi:hypothetical protein
LLASCGLLVWRHGILLWRWPRCLTVTRRSCLRALGVHAVSRAHGLSVDTLVATSGRCAVSSSVCRICHGLLLVDHLAGAVRFASEGELSLGGDRVRS